MATTHIYPSDLRDNKRSNTYINFSCRTVQNSEVFSCILYAPPGINITDGAGYGDFNLGVLGGTKAGQDFVTDVIENDSDINKEGLKEALGGAADNKMLTLTAFSNFGLGGGAVDRAKDIYGYATGQAINPNTVLQFSNTNIRNFSFQFKMVASSEAESRTIKEIIKGFRVNLYPEKDQETSMIFKYPNIWDINFFTSKGEGTDLPNLAQCYLTEVNTGYNGTGNSWFGDGKSPSEVSLTLSFREFKALDKDDITTLEDGGAVKKVGGD